MSIIVNNTDNQLNINNNGVLDVYAVKSVKSVSRAVDASGNYYIAINFIANDKNNSLRIYLSEVSSPVTWTNDLTGANAALADIRDWLSEIIDVQISEANDSILVYGWDGTTNRKIKTDANGELQVDVLTTPGTFAEDTAHISGNTGAFVLGVRNDLNVPMTSANGDYSPIAVSGAGAVAIQDGGSSLTVDGGNGLLRTTGMIRPTGLGNVNTTAGSTFFSVSVANVGSANGTVLAGVTIKPGEVLNFSADAINNFFDSFAYNATGTEFIIIYVA
jgi:hypothetical protein